MQSRLDKEDGHPEAVLDEPFLKTETPRFGSSPSPAHQFDLHGWVPDPEISDDLNYMTIVFLITRSSNNFNGQQGHMGAIIVKESVASLPASPIAEESHRFRIFTNILGAATNVPLFGNKEVTSDIHAEISALGQACQASHSTTGCTAYITIPPCKRCFAALVAFGIRRIVTRQEASREIRETAHAHGIDVVTLDHADRRRQMQMINNLLNPSRSDEQLMEIVERNRRIRRERKLAKKTRNKI